MGIIRGQKWSELRRSSWQKRHDERAPLRKKVCRYCSKVFVRNVQLSDKQWDGAKFCSKQCNASSRKLYETRHDFEVANRRQHGQLEQGTPEWRERIAKATKLAMYRPEVQVKIRQKRASLSLERRQRQSDLLAGKMPANMLYGNRSYPNVKRGNYDINGTEFYFRSMWEANYALYLDFLIDCKQIVKWEYETDVFIFEKIQFGTRSYRPDFKVFNLDGSIEYHEVKGYMDSRSETKLKRMAKYYPKVKILLIRRQEYVEIKRKLGKMLKFY